MITGDSKTTASAIAKELDLDIYTVYNILRKFKV